MIKIGAQSRITRNDFFYLSGPEKAEEIQVMYVHQLLLKELKKVIIPEKLAEPNGDILYKADIRVITNTEWDEVREAFRKFKDVLNGCVTPEVADKFRELYQLLIKEPS